MLGPQNPLEEKELNVFGCGIDSRDKLMCANCEIGFKSVSVI